MPYWFLDGGGGWRFTIPYMSKGDTIIGSNPQINRFFKEFTDYNVIETSIRPSLWTKNPFRLFYNILKTKIEYRKYFRDISGDSIYILGGLTTITFFSYIKKLSKKNTVIYVMKDLDVIKQKEYYFFGRRIMKFIAYLMGVNVGITKQLGKPNWCLKENTLENYNHLKYSMEEPEFNLPEKFRKLLEGKETLLILSDFRLLMKEPGVAAALICCVLDKKTTILKNSTREPLIPDELFPFDAFPSYVPVEFLISNHNWKNIVTVYISKSLTTETDINKISMYNMIEWKDPVAPYWLQICHEKNVKLPKTKGEFRKVLL